MTPPTARVTVDDRGLPIYTGPIELLAMICSGRLALADRAGGEDAWAVESAAMESLTQGAEEVLGWGCTYRLEERRG